MSGTDEFLAELLSALGDLFEPLDRAADGGDALLTLLAKLGWTLEPTATAAPQELLDIAGAVVDLAEQADDLLSDDDAVVSAASSAAFDDVVEIAGSAAALGAVQGIPDAFKDEALPEKLTYLLVYEYLADHQPKVFAILRLAGILDEELKPAPTLPQGATSEFARPYLERQVVFERVATAVTNPGRLPADVYGWGTTDFRADTLLRVVEVNLRAFGLRVSPDTTAGVHLYWDPDTVRTQAQRALVMPAWSGVAGDAAAQVDLIAIPIPPGTGKGTPATKPEGIAIFPRFIGTLDASFEVTEGITLEIEGHIEDEGAVVAELRPSGPSLTLNIAPQDIDEVSATIGVKIAPAAPLILVGAAKSSRLELAQAHAELGVGLKLGNPEMHFGAGIDKLSLVIDLGKGDGFLQKILGGEPQQLDFGAGLNWSTEEGLRFNGTATLRLELPVHLDLAGIAQIDTIHIVLGAVTAPQPGVQLEISITGGLTLGPFAAQVDRLGVAMNLIESPTHQGSLGDLDMLFSFKPPNGLGFVVDAGPVKGGGYVSFDFVAGEYAGILELSVAGQFAIKAIGILATKMPDGRPGFSMLLIITAEFPPIQLGYGFTLNGVGGAIGINRTMNREFLRNGIHTGALESILFPPDPVAHANEVISNLKQGFPIAEGRFIFGPMLKLGWASIITLEVGVLLELPMPIVLAILGRLKCALPEGEDSVLVLQMDILGIIDFGTGDISIDATLNDSRIVTFPITGDFALRANVGSHPDFALSAGGFHPRFTPPGNFPAMQRLGISISSGDNPRLRMEAYFALTTNTVQTGARVEFYVGADLGMLGSFSAEAELGFDAMIHFQPFELEARLYGSASVKRNGEELASADLELVLTGPTPWHAYGHAILHFFGDHELAFDETFGDPPPPAALPAADVAALVRDAVGEAGAWGARAPGNGRALVTLRDPAAGTGVLLHPLSELTVHQRVAPLATRLDQYASGPITGPTTITIDAVAVTGVVTQGLDDLDDAFAPGQYFALTDDQKLTRPSFERFPAGKTVRTASFVTATAQKADQHYVTITVDDPKLDVADDRLAALAGAYRPGAALRASLVELHGTARYDAPSQGIAVAEPEWVLAGRDDLKGSGKHATYTAAAAALDGAPGVGEQRIVGAFEAVPA